jgi:hypothetical protein
MIYRTLGSTGEKVSSRYDGKVIQGPANKNLEPREL